MEEVVHRKGRNVKGTVSGTKGGAVLLVEEVLPVFKRLPHFYGSPIAVFLFPSSVEYHSGCEVPVKVQIVHDGVVVLSGHAWEVVHKGYGHLPSFLLTPTQRTYATTSDALQGPEDLGVRRHSSPSGTISRAFRRLWVASRRASVAYVPTAAMPLSVTTKNS